MLVEDWSSCWRTAELTTAIRRDLCRWFIPSRGTRSRHSVTTFQVEVITSHLLPTNNRIHWNCRSISASQKILRHWVIIELFSSFYLEWSYISVKSNLGLSEFLSTTQKFLSTNSFYGPSKARQRPSGRLIKVSTGFEPGSSGCRSGALRFVSWLDVSCT